MNEADTLAACLLEMAEMKTNPVLQVINLDEPLEENKKYPADLLQFNHLGWRAYYHCHPASRAGNHRFKGEHGHFHIFVRIQEDPEKWSHLVALAMDNMGQPLGWFTVNHWVTGEAWLDTEALVNYLETIPYDNPEIIKVIERWLLSLLALSRDKVKTVLHERDIAVKQRQTKDESNVKKNENIYLLSEIPINIIDLFDHNELEN